MEYAEFKNRVQNLDHSNSLEVERLRDEIKINTRNWNKYWVEVLALVNKQRYRLVGMVERSIIGEYATLKMKFSDYDEGLMDHAEGKRPLGNKNKPASIVFTTGIDIHDAIMLDDRLPDFVESWSNQLLNEDIENLKTDIDRYKEDKQC